VPSCPGCGAYLQPFRSGFDVKCWNCRLDLSGYEYVRSSSRQGAYLRRRPYHRDLPTKPQREFQATVAEVAIREGRGKMGTTTIEKGGQQKEIPLSVVPVMEGLKGKVFTKRRVPPPAPPFEEELLERLTSASGGSP